MKDYGKKIGSHKWIPLMYQIASRMNNNETPFSDTLNSIIERITIEHPYHSLYQLFALSNGNRAEKNKQQLKLKVDQDRIVAATQMIVKVKKTQKKIRPIIDQLEQLTNAYIELASMVIDKNNTAGAKALPKSIAKLTNLTLIPLTTTETPIDLSCKYEDIVYIKSFAPTFSLVGGLNLPRKITCTTSDGQNHSQLVKGNDDLRQDAGKKKNPT